MKQRDLVRLKRVLLTDQMRIPNGMADLLRNDMVTVLDGYFELDKKSLQLVMTIEDSGLYRISVQAQASAVRKMQTI